jgi:hypothetical protein
LNLPQNEPYPFEIEHEGFEHFGGFTSDPVPPGTTDLRIVLKKGSSMTFLVVDAGTLEPIEQYGIEVEEIAGDGWTRSENSGPLRVGEHAGGECRLVLPRGKAVLHVEAPDHAPAGLDVAEDSEGARRQTIRLARGSELSGRVLRGGSAVAGVRAILDRCPVKIDASQPDETPDERLFSDNYRFDLSPFVGRTREVAVGSRRRLPGSACSRRARTRSHSAHRRARLSSARA